MLQVEQGCTRHQHAGKCPKHGQVVSKYSPCCFVFFLLVLLVHGKKVLEYVGGTLRFSATLPEAYFLLYMH